jgi:hypothetical protein
MICANHNVEAISFSVKYKLYLFLQTFLLPFHHICRHIPRLIPRTWRINHSIIVYIRTGNWEETCASPFFAIIHQWLHSSLHSAQIHNLNTDRGIQDLKFSFPSALTPSRFGIGSGRQTHLEKRREKRTHLDIPRHDESRGEQAKNENWRKVGRRELHQLIREIIQKPKTNTGAIKSRAVVDYIEKGQYNYKMDGIHRRTQELYVLCHWSSSISICSLVPGNVS